jgi:hypothetical protein
MLPGERLGPDERRGPEQEPTAIEGAGCIDARALDAKFRFRQSNERREVTEECRKSATRQGARAVKDVSVEHVSEELP